MANNELSNKSKQVTLQNSRINLPIATETAEIAEVIATVLAEKYSAGGIVRCFDATTRLGSTIEFEAEEDTDSKADKADKVMQAAKDFVHEVETWEGYQDLKTSVSAALPVEFMALCEAVEDFYGTPKLEDNG